MPTVPTAPPSLTAAPLSPDRADRATFTARAIALDNWHKNFNLPEMVLALENAYLNASYVQTTAVVVQTDRGVVEAAAATVLALNPETNAALARDWATKTTAEVVYGQGFGAKKYALDSATSAAASDTARAAAVVAQNNAVAVVTGGTAQLTAAPSKIPIANADGYLDPTWTANNETAIQLAEGVAFATDLAGQTVALANAATATANSAVASVTTEADARVLADQQLLEAAAFATDIAGQAAKAVAGGEVMLGAGSATLPTLYPTGDRDTGLFFPAANTMAGTNGGVESWRTDSSGRTGFGTNAPTGVLDVNDNRIRVRTAQTPATAASAGNAGDLCWDAGYIYVAVATNTWKRAALTTW